MPLMAILSKMKYFLLLISLLTFSVTSLAQKTDAVVKQEKQLDKKLEGSWEGSEKDKQIQGMEKHWIMHRFTDGTFVLLFVAVKNGKTQKFSEKGKWWVEGNTFYEFHNVSGKTDVYEYKVLDDDHVKFKAKEISIEMEDSSYEFVDTRLPGI
jgi:hypothetical protein